MNCRHLVRKSSADEMGVIGTNPENAARLLYCPTLGGISANVSGRFPRTGHLARFV